MADSQRVFREYILFRSRIVAYAAVVLTIFFMAGLAALLVTGPDNITRFGLVLQILGVLALAPEVIGREKFARWQQAERVGVPQTGPAANDPPVVDAPAQEETFYKFYQDNNPTFVMGNILASVALVWLLVDYVLNPRPAAFPLEGVWRVLFSLLGFAWLNFFMLLHIYRLSGTSISRGLLAWFFAADMFVGILGVVFAGLFHIFLRWVADGLVFIFSNGPRRVVLIITLPFFVVGLFFELIATFL